MLTGTLCTRSCVVINSYSYPAEQNSTKPFHTRQLMPSRQMIRDLRYMGSRVFCQCIFNTAISYPSANHGDYRKTLQPWRRLVSKNTMTRLTRIVLLKMWTIRVNRNLYLRLKDYRPEDIIFETITPTLQSHMSKATGYQIPGQIYIK